MTPNQTRLTAYARQAQRASQSWRRKAKAMKLVIYVCFLIFSSQTVAIGPTLIKFEHMVDDVKFIGIVEIIHAKAMTKTSETGDICGVAYKVRVIETVFGKTSSDMINLHMLHDSRGNYIHGNKFGFLEVGSKYLIYTEDRSTHRRINLTDVGWPETEYPETCHSTKRKALYVYPEFTSKLTLVASGYDLAEDVVVVQGNGLNNIVGIESIRRLWISSETGEYSVGVRSRMQAMEKELHLQGLLLKDLTSFIREGLNKAKQSGTH